MITVDPLFGDPRNGIVVTASGQTSEGCLVRERVTYRRDCLPEIEIQLSTTEIYHAEDSNENPKKG